MKVVRLPSGPLACVYSLDADQTERETVPQSSGTFRAHSGSLHADGETEDEALAVLDEHVRRITIPPTDDSAPSHSAPAAPEQSRWAMRVRKCGPQETKRHDRADGGDADTPFDGVTIPPPFSTSPPSKANR